LKVVAELEFVGVDEFQIRYKKKDFDNVIQNDFSINVAKLTYFQQYRNYLQWMLNEENDGYKRVICNKIKFSYKDILSAESSFEKIDIELLLAKLLNKRLYKDDIEKFKNDFFGKIFSPKKTDYRKRGVRCVNAILDENNSSFFVISNQSNTKENRKERYWMVSSK